MNRQGWIPRVKLIVTGILLTTTAAVLGLAAVGSGGSLRSNGGLARGTAPAGASSSVRHGLLSLPTLAQPAISAGLGRADPAYRIAGSVARNPAQRFSARFGRRGVMIAAGSAHFELSLVSFGRAGALARLGPASPKMSASGASYAFGPVSEWWTNGPLGLEQGFGVTRRLAGAGRLDFSIAITGRVRLDHGTVLLPGGLRYAGLEATDARGRVLNATLALRRNQIVVHVNDRGARYPLRVDPVIQQAELTASDGSANDQLGYSVAIDGDTTVVGAPAHEVGSNRQQGAVYVFVKPAAGWASGVQTAELTATDGLAYDRLGTSVAISGDTVVAGAPSHTEGMSTGQGAVYVFVKPSDGWSSATQTSELTMNDGVAYDNLGASVAISGDTVVAGAPDHTEGASSHQGAVYVFQMPPGGWPALVGNQTSELTMNDGVADDDLGASVAIAGNTVVAGAPDHTEGAASQEGAVYVFQMPAGGWPALVGNQTSELTTNDGGADDRLGYSVAIWDDTVVAGAPLHAVGMASSQGAVYMFEMPPGGWPAVVSSPTSESTASDGDGGDLLGLSVAVSGDTVLGGAYVRSAAYVFSRPLPGITITSPADHALFTQGQIMDAAYTCTDQPQGSGVASCDSPISNGEPIDTMTLGQHTLSVTAIDNAGQQTSETVNYTVLPAAEITVGTPANGASYTQGLRVDAAYSCTSATSCTGPVTNGAPIDTSTSGSHNFTVTATDNTGQQITRTVTYTIVAPGALPGPGTPTISMLSESARTWRETNQLPQIGAASKPKRAVGTIISFTLNEPATVNLSFTQKTIGRKVNGRCTADSRSNRHKPRCSRPTVAGELRFSGLAATNQVHFAGRISPTRKLKPGHYTLVITATNNNDQRSAPQSIDFTIVR
jgi:hypothetical protein